jgi:hypothetical protein
MTSETGAAALLFGLAPILRASRIDIRRIAAERCGPDNGELLPPLLPFVTSTFFDFQTPFQQFRGYSNDGWEDFTGYDPT